MIKWISSRNRCRMSWSPSSPKTSNTQTTSVAPQPMMIDIHCYPMVERMVMLEDSRWYLAFDYLDIKKIAPSLYAYVHRFRAHPRMKPHVIRAENYSRQMEIWDLYPEG